ncbi:hypothetical protein FXO38_13166 [Capsicum annuum]|nr:hypothetical protein FXO38_13166 [Capsicum annuum]
MGCGAVDGAAPPLTRGRGYDPGYGENSVGSVATLMSPATIGSTGGLCTNILHAGRTLEPKHCFLGGDGSSGPGSCNDGRKGGHVCHHHSGALSSPSFEGDEEGQGAVKQPCMDVDGSLTSDEL